MRKNIQARRPDCDKKPPRRRPFSSCVVKPCRSKRKGCRSTLRKSGAPGEIRTPDHQVRSLVLYPAELRARRSGIIKGRGYFVNPILSDGRSARRAKARYLRRAIFDPRLSSRYPSRPRMIRDRRFGQRAKLKIRRGAREAEGAPLLREYRVKNSIEGSNPSLSARNEKGPMALFSFS